MMNPENEVMDDLLVKYMLDEATAEEQGQVRAWLSAHADNETYYRQLQEIWQKSKALEAHTTVSEEDAWQRFQQKVATGNAPAPVVAMVRPGRAWWRAAAAIIVLATGGWLMYQKVLVNGNTTITARNSVVTDTLPDGSVVTLNKNATLAYHNTFADSKRDVTLKGEAFFEIAADKNKPFTIATGDAIEIKVLGTSFNVKNAAAATEVIVETGMVEVRHRQQTIRLQAHEKVTISPNGITLNKQENKSELYNHYRTHTFVCKATPLSELVAILNEAYQANIVISDKLSHRNDLTLTTTFREESLDSIIHIVCQTFGITARKSNNSIVLE